jgi:hypothetical protein
MSRKDGQIILPIYIWGPNRLYPVSPIDCKNYAGVDHLDLPCGLGCGLRDGASITYGLTLRGDAMIVAIRETLSRDHRVLCVDPKPDSCRNAIMSCVGDRRTVSAMTIAEAGSDPFYEIYELHQ